MTSFLKKLSIPVLAACALIPAASVQGATISVDPGDAWLGYMNVSNIPSQGGAYQWGSTWGTADLTATWSGPVLALGVNSINDPNPYWYTPAGIPGSVGNKIMDASMYVETTGTYVGTNVTFTGTVLSNTLVGQHDANGNGWTSVAFIKDFAPDYSSSVSTTVPLTAGTFNITLATINDPARHIQYGFETVGPDVWSTDAGNFGNIQVTAVPEPAVLGALALSAVIPLARRRRQ